MFNKNFLLLFTAIFHLAKCQDTITADAKETTNIFLSDDNNINWSPKSTESVIIEAAEGYKISVNVTECNIDGENGEYAIISTDDDTNELIFTYAVSRHPSYLYYNNKLLAQFVGTNSSNFTVVFTRVAAAMVTTSTDVQKTDVLNYNSSSTLLVYLAGTSIGDYLDPNNTQLLNNLRKSIAAMATKYCENVNLSLNGPVTSDNVVINYLLSCPMDWPDYETCVLLNFSVKVNFIEDVGPHQITSAHLRIMWSKYASKTYLPAGATIYFPPSHDGLIAVPIFSH